MRGILEHLLWYIYVVNFHIKNKNGFQKRCMIFTFRANIFAFKNF